MSEQMLDIARIRIDGDTQSRMAIDEIVVAEYASMLEGGAEFPPVQVVSDGAAHWLVDGFHRYFAHHRLGRKQIKAEVTSGLREDAQWLSLSANKAHGLRRTNMDKAKAVIKALVMKPQLSDSAIAQHVGVAHVTVARHRTSIEEARQQRESKGSATPPSGRTMFNLPTRVGRDGKKYPVRKRRKAGISPNALTPIRSHSQPVDPMTPMSMPRDPEMGAHILFDLFDQPYIRSLITRLQALLDGTAGPAPLLQEIAAARKN